jgi:hypothetical protein
MSRPHPLGVQSHPEWDGVWDRYVELSEGPAAAEEPTPLADEPFPDGAIIWGAIICLGFAVLLAGGLA